MQFNPTVLRKTKIVSNFGLSECNRVKKTEQTFMKLPTAKSLRKGIQICSNFKDMEETSAETCEMLKHLNKYSK